MNKSTEYIPGSESTARKKEELEEFLKQQLGESSFLKAMMLVEAAITHEVMRVSTRLVDFSANVSRQPPAQHHRKEKNSGRKGIIALGRDWRNIVT